MRLAMQTDGYDKVTINSVRPAAITIEFIRNETGGRDQRHEFAFQ